MVYKLKFHTLQSPRLKMYRRYFIGYKHTIRIFFFVISGIVEVKFRYLKIPYRILVVYRVSVFICAYLYFIIRFRVYTPHKAESDI